MVQKKEPQSSWLSPPVVSSSNNTHPVTDVAFGASSFCFALLIFLHPPNTSDYSLFYRRRRRFLRYFLLILLWELAQVTLHGSNLPSFAPSDRTHRRQRFRLKFSSSCCYSIFKRGNTQRSKNSPPLSRHHRCKPASNSGRLVSSFSGQPDTHGKRKSSSAGHLQKSRFFVVVVESKTLHCQPRLLRWCVSSFPFSPLIRLYHPPSH